LIDLLNIKSNKIKHFKYLFIFLRIDSSDFPLSQPCLLPIFSQAQARFAAEPLTIFYALPVFYALTVGEKFLRIWHDRREFEKF
jgi:hypothetical protein